MARDGLVEALAFVEPAEVERLAPAVLVQIRRQVVVLPGQGCVGLDAVLASLLASPLLFGLGDGGDGGSCDGTNLLVLLRLLAGALSLPEAKV